MRQVLSMPGHNCHRRRGSPTFLANSPQPPGENRRWSPLSDERPCPACWPSSLCIGHQSADCLSHSKSSSLPRTALGGPIAPPYRVANQSSGSPPSLSVAKRQPARNPCLMGSLYVCHPGHNNAADMVICVRTIQCPTSSCRPRKTRGAQAELERHPSSLAILHRQPPGLISSVPSTWQSKAVAWPTNPRDGRTALTP